MSFWSKLWGSKEPKNEVRVLNTIEEVKPPADVTNEHSTISQNKAILRHLKTGRAITPIEALNLFGSFRLSARIFNLREQGHDIITTRINKNGKNYASYRLKQ